MAKGIYVGVSGEVTVQGDIIPKAWTNTTHDTYIQEYTAEDGTKIFSYGGVTTNAFDGNTGSYWRGMTTGAGYNYIGIIFTEPKKITKLKTHVKETYSAVFQIQGSNNGSEWITLTGWGANQTALTEMVLENTDYYSQYRIYFPNEVASLPEVYEIQVSEYVVAKSNIARKVTKAYVGVENKARKVKKGYIGVGDKARLFLSSEKVLSYYGTASQMTARHSAAGASVGNKVIFAGGYSNSSSYLTQASAYDTTLTKSTANALSKARRDAAGASVGNYALFAGGNTGSPSYIVDAYTSALVRSTVDPLVNARMYLAGASVEGYAIFAGGYSNSTYHSKAEAFDTNLTKQLLSDLDTARYYLAGASVENYALFAGGYSGSVTSKVDVYSKTTKTTSLNLSTSRQRLAGASTGNYALFAGGSNNTTTTYSKVDAFNSSLVRSTPTELSISRNFLAGASVEGYAIFAGGYSNGIYYATVDAYNSNLVRSLPTELSAARQQLAGGSVGNYALFACGVNASDQLGNVDVYQVVG